MDPDGQIPFRGRLTQNDWCEAMELVRTTRQVPNPRYHGLKVLLVALIFMVLALRLPWLLLLAGLLAYIAWEHLTLDRRTWRLKHAHDQNGFFSAAGFETATSESTDRWQWEAVVRSFSRANLLVLETGPSSFLVLPRHFFASEEDWQALNDLLRTAAPSQLEEPLSPAPPPAPAQRGWAADLGRAGCFVLLGLLVLVIAYLVLGFLVLLLAGWSEQREISKPSARLERVAIIISPRQEDFERVAIIICPHQEDFEHVSRSVRPGQKASERASEAFAQVRKDLNTLKTRSPELGGLEYA